MLRNGAVCNLRGNIKSWCGHNGFSVSFGTTIMIPPGNECGKKNSRWLAPTDTVALHGSGEVGKYDTYRVADPERPAVSWSKPCAEPNFQFRECQARG